MLSEENTNWRNQDAAKLADRETRLMHHHGAVPVLDAQAAAICR